MVLFNLGKAMKEQGKLDECLDAFRRATELDPQFGDAWHEMGMTWWVKGNADAAEDALWKVVDLKSDPEALLTLGTILKQKGNLHGALRAFSEAVRIRPIYPEAHYSLGMTLRQLDRPDEALRELQVAETQRREQEITRTRQEENPE